MSTSKHTQLKNNFACEADMTMKLSLDLIHSEATSLNTCFLQI